jgi:hypothetical protein
VSKLTHPVRGDAAPLSGGFNGRLRDELLSSETFETLAEAKYLVDQWTLYYYHRRHQRALCKVTLAAYTANGTAAPPLRLAPLACGTSPRHNEVTLTIPQPHLGGGPMGAKAMFLPV